MATSLKHRRIRRMVADLKTRIAELEEELVDAAHGPDFASVQWFGTTYTFTATQAAAVKILWKAWEAGTPAVRQETLLDGAASDAGRVSDIFTDSEAWGTMIRQGSKRGTFQLCEPDEN